MSAKKEKPSIVLGGEIYIVLTMNFPLQYRHQVPLDFFPIVTPETSVDRMIMEIQKQKPCFQNLPNCSPMEFIETLTEAGYVPCDPHSLVKNEGRLSPRILMKRHDDPDAKPIEEFPEEVRAMLSKACFLWGHDNRQTHSKNIALDFNGPRDGKSKNHPVVGEGGVLSVG